MIFHNPTTGRTISGLLAMAFLATAAGCASHGQPESVAAASQPANAVADSGATADGNTSEAATEEIPAEKKLICRRIKPTGSRMGERVCMRQAQWEKYAGQSRRGLEDIQRKALTTNDQGG